MSGLDLATAVRRSLDERTEMVSVHYSICPRMASYVYNLDVRTAMKERVKAMPHLSLGGFVHVKTLDNLKGMGCEIERKMPLDEYGCPGRFFKADAVCGDTVVELKSATNDSFRQLWEWQLKVYMALLGLRKGKLLVIWMPTGGVSEHDLSIDEREAEEAKGRVRRMCAAITKDWRDVEAIKGRWCFKCPIKRLCPEGRLV